MNRASAIVVSITIVCLTVIFMALIILGFHNGDVRNRAYEQSRQAAISVCKESTDPALCLSKIIP